MSDKITATQCRDLREAIRIVTDDYLLTQDEFAEILNVLIGATQRMLREEAQNETN